MHIIFFLLNYNYVCLYVLLHIMSADTSRWIILSNEGTEELVREGLSQILQKSLSLTDAQRAEFDVISVPPGSFVRGEEELYAPVTLKAEEVPWHITAVPT